MHLVQILLPLRDNAGRPYEEQLFTFINHTLIDAFGGVTAFARTPAHGVWAHAGHKKHDDVIIVEVMVESLDRTWWRAFREQLESRMKQAEIVVRAHRIARL